MPYGTPSAYGDITRSYRVDKTQILINGLPAKQYYLDQRLAAIQKLLEEILEELRAE